MRRMIDRYINSIATNKEIRFDGQPETESYTFYGDGVGDFEEIGDDTTLECLYNYRMYLKRQLELTNKIIIEKTNEDKSPV